MYNHEASAHRKLNLKSLLICWVIILGGYLLIRMAFLVCGLQLHLTAQGICLALLPYVSLRNLRAKNDHGAIPYDGSQAWRYR